MIKNCATFWIGKNQVSYKEFISEIFRRFK